MSATKECDDTFVERSKTYEKTRADADDWIRFTDEAIRCLWWDSDLRAKNLAAWRLRAVANYMAQQMAGGYDGVLTVREILTREAAG